MFYLSPQQCSHLCGHTGRQIRRLYCQDVTGRKVARFHCPLKYKPQRKRKCNQRRCGSVNCLEIQKRLKVSTDGEYWLLIGGRNMSIYCHGMLSAQPREYLTLPAGGGENYAEIYDKRFINFIMLSVWYVNILFFTCPVKIRPWASPRHFVMTRCHFNWIRLKTPHTCPFNGQRNDSCDCVSELGTLSGRTMFKRVRIDPERLYIIGKREFSHFKSYIRRRTYLIYVDRVSFNWRILFICITIFL